MRRNNGVCDELVYGPPDHQHAGTGICRDGSDAADCGYAEESHGSTRPSALRNGDTDYQDVETSTLWYVGAGYLALIPCVVACYVHIKKHKANGLVPKRTALAATALAAVVIYTMSPPGDYYFPWSSAAMGFMVVKIVYCNDDCYRPDTVRDDGQWVLDEPLDATGEEPTYVPPLVGEADDSGSEDGCVIEIAAQPVAPPVVALAVQYAQEFDELSASQLADQTQIVAAVSVFVPDQASTTVGGAQAGDLHVEPNSEATAVASFEVEG